MRTAFVIPNYNHRDAIEQTLQQLQQFGIPCYLVNDGSDQVTTDLLQQLDTQHEWVTLIQHQVNQGKGGAVMTGLKAAFADGFTHALQVDADGQHQLDDIPKMLATAVQNPKAVVSGLPQYDESVPKGRLYGRYLTHFWVWVETLSLEIKDSMCGFRVYPLTETVQLINQDNLGKRMDFDIEILVKLHWQGIRVVHVPTQVIYPENGISHFQGLQDNIRISKMHTKLFFGMLSRLPKRIFSRKQDNTHWSQTKERGSYLGVKLLAQSYRLGGHFLCRCIMYPVIGYFFLTGTKARTASLSFHRHLSQYRICSGDDNRIIEPSLWNSFKHFISFGNAALDRIDAWCERISLQQVIFENRTQFYIELGTEKGAVLLASHLGNIELCRAISAQNRNITVNVLVRTSNAENFNRVLKQLNPASDVNLIAVDELSLASSMLLQDKIAQGELVVIAADRTSNQAKERVFFSNFLGQKAAFPQGPFILAALLDCPVYTMFCLQNSDKQYQVFLEKLSDSLDGPRRGRMDRLQLAVDSYSSRLEKIASRYPLQWFNFYNFWQQPNNTNIEANSQKRVRGIKK